MFSKYVFCSKYEMYSSYYLLVITCHVTHHTLCLGYPASPEVTRKQKMKVGVLCCLVVAVSAHKSYDGYKVGGIATEIAGADILLPGA